MSEVSILQRVLVRLSGGFVIALHDIPPERLADFVLVSLLNQVRLPPDRVVGCLFGDLPHDVGQVGVWHAQARQVAPEAAPGSVPALPLASPLSMILKSESELQRKLD